MTQTQYINHSECSRDLIVDTINMNATSLDDLMNDFIRLRQEVSDLIRENENLKSHIDYLEYELSRKQDKE